MDGHSQDSQGDSSETHEWICSLRFFFPVFCLSVTGWCWLDVRSPPKPLCHPSSAGEGAENPTGESRFIYCQSNQRGGNEMESQILKHHTSNPPFFLHSTSLPNSVRNLIFGEEQGGRKETGLGSEIRYLRLAPAPSAVSFKLLWVCSIISNQSYRLNDCPIPTMVWTYRNLGSDFRSNDSIKLGILPQRRHKGFPNNSWSDYLTVGIC